MFIKIIYYVLTLTIIIQFCFLLGFYSCNTVDFYL